MLHKVFSLFGPKQARPAAGMAFLALTALALFLASCQTMPFPQAVEVTRVVETVVTATPEPAGETPAEAEPVAADVDRVGYPEGYQEDFSVFYEFDRPDNRTARVIYANEAAASVQPGEPFPYGSILVMDVYRTQRDDAGNVLLDENGRYIRDELSGAFIMRKEPGFGAKYQEFRNGEWEYVAYRPDGSVLTPPERTNSCAACHMEAGQGKDWVFGTHRFFASGEEAEPPEPPENTVIMRDYAITPATLTVPAGTEVTWINDDLFIHTVTANDLSFGSGALRPTFSFRHTFETPGTYEYFCAVHPSMRGTIVVTE